MLLEKEDDIHLYIFKKKSTQIIRTDVEKLLKVSEQQRKTYLPCFKQLLNKPVFGNQHSQGLFDGFCGIHQSDEKAIILNESKTASCRDPST